MTKKNVIALNEQDFIKLLYDMISGAFKGDSKNKSNQKKIEPQPKNRQTKSVGDFEKTTRQIIDQFEGGYYHPDMLKDGRVKDKRYARSGETMFGIDRLRGVKESNSAAGKEFWSIIDRQNARKKWRWNYKLQDNPDLALRLKNLVAKIMEPLFIDYQNRYLSEESKKIVNSTPELYYHFAYATWNGIGWFKKFAQAFNEEVKKGKSIKELINFVLSQRKNSGNSLISQSGRKMEKTIGIMT
jgi:hypothetical protein